MCSETLNLLRNQYVRAIIVGAALNIKFRPYVFFHHICISNTMAMNEQNSSRIFQATGNKNNFSGFQTIGCIVWTHLSGKQKANFKQNIVKDIILCYVSYTHCNILWYNCDKGYIGPANHVRFDEGMHDLSYKIIPPNQHDLE